MANFYLIAKEFLKNTFKFKFGICPSIIPHLPLRQLQVKVQAISTYCLAGQIRQVELHFTVGEALSCAGAGRQSEVARDPWAVQQLKSSECGEAAGIMKELIDVIISKYAASPIPYVRQVGVDYLLLI